MAPQEDLSRFTEAHARDYAQALGEIRTGRKRSHWMWYIFPQIEGLGRSLMSREYAIRDLAEARAFLADPVLGAHLEEISRALLAQEERDPHRIFGSPDDMKLCSCMTLFAAAAGGDSVYQQVLDAFFPGGPDRKTLAILGL